MAVGHFELARRREGRVGWEFVTDQGTTLACSPDSYTDPQEAKTDAARFVLELRTATYGLRFEAELADAVRDV